VVRQTQQHGINARITDRGIFIKAPNGEEFSLPPDLNSLIPARPGTYRMRSTGEVIDDPDYLSTWTINVPPPGGAQ
jgi:hypothetical protein